MVCFIVGPFSVSSSLPVVVGSLLSTCNPACEQGLATVVAGAGQLHCPGVVVAVIVLVFRLVTKKDC